jgi:hypothetical protein
MMLLMAPGLVLLVNGAVGVALVAIAGKVRVARLRSRWSVAWAALPLLAAALLSVYVFGEDSYRGHGISRWDAYRSPGGALGPMFVLSIALMGACAAALAYAALSARERMFRSAALAGGLTSLILLTATIIGFSNN